MPRLTPDDLVRWSRTLYAGDQLDAATARRLMDEIDALWAEDSFLLQSSLDHMERADQRLESVDRVVHACAQRSSDDGVCRYVGIRSVQ